MPVSSRADRAVRLGALAALMIGAGPAPAQEAPPQAGAMLSLGRTFAETGGASLFANVCQGCHMPDGRGASGAGIYPSLAGDANLAVAAYATHVVVKGLRAMPPVGRAMSDDQVAAVVNYVRTHFGNAYADGVTAGDVSSERR